jgi:anti-anti-sigma regulatory factor
MIRLEGEANIALAAELKQMLLQALASGKGVSVDLSGATDLDVTVVQLLWTAGREARKLNVEFGLTEVFPEQISTTLEDAGFEQVLVSTPA